MNRAERRAAARASRRPVRLAGSKRSPVTAAVEQRRTRRMVDDIGIKAYLTPDGGIDHELIAQFVFLIGLGAEVSMNLADDVARTKRLHAGLRTLVGMSVDGGRWQAGQTTRMLELAREAQALSIRHELIAIPLYPFAAELSDRVASGKATMADVAGAEVYQEVNDGQG